MRILWVSNAPYAPSGYGEQTALFAPRLRDAGHDVAIACTFGLQATWHTWDGITLYPAWSDWVGGIPVWVKQHQADLVIVLYDAWKLNPAGWQGGARAAVWAPVDHDPIPPAVAETLAQPSVTPVAISTFGEKAMKNAGLEPLYVPHGIDTGLFAPRPELKDETRDELGIPRDVFLVGTVAANQSAPWASRKGFPQMFQAFAKFAKSHADAFLFLHTQWKTGGGHNLALLAEACKLSPDQLRYTPEEAWRIGIPREVVAKMYQAFDVLLMPSMGEGFGIPLLEAQASGVPVITSDWTAMPELAQAGWTVGGDPWWDEVQQSWYLTPHVANIVAALEAAYQHRDDTDLRAGARAFAVQYDADTVMRDYWLPALDKIMETREIGPLTPNRAMRRAAKRTKVPA